VRPDTTEPHLGLLDYTDELIETVNHWEGHIAAPMPKHRGKTRIRVYKNRFIEDYFATAHPATPGIWFGGPILYGLYYALFSDALTPIGGAGLFVLGIIAWTLLEYVLHRWVFHWDFGKETFDQKVKSFLLHGYHHEFPNDPWRLVAPPVMSWPGALIVGGIYYLVAGPHLWIPLFSGTCLGYLTYDWMHYYTHHGRPTWWLGKVIRRSHMVHHFKLFHLNMGISSPVWDVVIGTFGWSEAAIKDALAEEKTLNKG